MELIDKISISKFDYNLPDERIAKFPLDRRDMSKLLLYKGDREIEHDVFRNLSAHIPDGSLMVFNNTRVVQARLKFTKSTGAVIEIFCLKPSHPADYSMVFQSTRECRWICLVGNLKRWKAVVLEEEITVNGRDLTLAARKVGQADGAFEIEFAWDNEEVTFGNILESAGNMPIPPYLNREAEESDNEDYQTVYARIKGSVAAPTAGLHFTSDVLGSLEEKRIMPAEITLHVGAGTFQPVKSEDVSLHPMHAENFLVTAEVLENIYRNLGKIIAVGTTSVRTLESLYWLGVKVSSGNCSRNEKLLLDQWECYQMERNLSVGKAFEALLEHMQKNRMTSIEADTRIIIVPGYRFRVVNGLVTNFHQPKSTLLLLIAAFVGDDWQRIYDYAMNNGFRFLSYGDSSLLFPEMNMKLL